MISLACHKWSLNGIVPSSLLLIIIIIYGVVNGSWQDLTFGENIINNKT